MLWRNRRERAEGIEILRKHEASVLCVKGPELDLTTAAGRLLAGLLGEVEQMPKRERREMRQRVERGLPPAALLRLHRRRRGAHRRRGRRGQGLLSRAARRSGPLRHGRRPQRARCHPRPQRQLQLGPRFEHGGVEAAGGRDAETMSSKSLLASAVVVGFVLGLGSMPQHHPPRAVDPGPSRRDSRAAGLPAVSSGSEKAHRLRQRTLAKDRGQRA